MTDFNKQELSRVILKCISKPCYKAIYFSSSYTNAMRDAADILELIDDIDDRREAVDQIKMSADEGLAVEFKNGSWFRVAEATKSRVDCEYNWAAVNPYVSDELSDAIIVAYINRCSQEQLENDE